MEDGKVIIKKIIVDESVEDGENRDVSKSEPPALSDDIKMLVTSMIHKGEESFTRVSFLRNKDWAEGIVPGGKIEKSEGFNEEEIGKLEAYLAGEEEMILQQAKGVNPLRNLFDMP